VRRAASGSRLDSALVGSVRQAARRTPRRRRVQLHLASVVASVTLFAGVLPSVSLPISRLIKEDRGNNVSAHTAYYKNMHSYKQPGMCPAHLVTSAGARQRAGGGAIRTCHLHEAGALHPARGTLRSLGGNM